MNTECHWCPCFCNYCILWLSAPSLTPHSAHSMRKQKQWPLRGTWGDSYTHMTNGSELLQLMTSRYLNVYICMYRSVIRVVCILYVQDNFDCHNGDISSLSSSLTEPDPASLRCSSSNSSLHLGYTVHTHTHTINCPSSDARWLSGQWRRSWSLCRVCVS